MTWTLTENSFALLLKQLDTDSERAGEKYEDLRRMLLRFFEWRGASFAEERTDETLNRLARKLAEGVNVLETRAYAMQIARLVLLEAFKEKDARRADWEELPQEPAYNPQQHWLEEKNAERNLFCLRQCMLKFPDETRQLILAYYRHSGRKQIEHRAMLAVKLGVRREALANRVQRLRDKLAECVIHCVTQK